MILNVCTGTRNDERRPNERNKAQADDESRPNCWLGLDSWKGSSMGDNPSVEQELIARDAKEQLRRWDEGRSIWSIEMGGLGPGYEQAIQVLAIEIVRDNIDKPLPDDDDREWGNATASRCDKACGGFSGAQVGAARQLAYKWLTIGPAAIHDIPELKDRHIQVSKSWPHIAEIGD